MIKQGQTADQDYIALTAEMFDRLVNNDAEKLRWVKEAVEQLKYYRGEKPDSVSNTPSGGNSATGPTGH